MEKMNRIHKYSLFYFLLIGIFLFFPLFGNLKTEDLESLFQKGVTVDLRQPAFSNGVLCTSEGGVVSGPNIRVQAKNIIYTRKIVEGTPIYTIVAEDQLLIEYGRYIFIGSRLEYDFQTGEGVVYEGKSAKEPWYFGGERIELNPDGDITVYNGYITTSEEEEPTWGIYTGKTTFTQDHIITARNIRFRIYKQTLLWLPVLKTNLDWIADSPIRLRIRTGGKQGLRIGLLYELLAWDRFKTSLRFDYRLNRGPGFGVETEYKSLDCKEIFTTVSYIARDSSAENPHERTRYRLEGIYSRLYDQDRLGLDLSYDKLSDKEMATDYYDRGLDLKTAGPTQLNVRRQFDQFSIMNFYTRVRVNDFQTIKQELPSVSGSLHPILLGSTGIILENNTEVSYLDFKYSDDVEHVHDFHAARIEYSPRIYRPFHLGPVSATPQAGMVSIYYGSSPGRGSDWLLVGGCGAEVKTHLYRHYASMKHILEPYVTYEYIAPPTISPNRHFIFDIEDGWFRLNTLRTGLRNLIFLKDENGVVSRYLTADFFAFTFFDTNTFRDSTPRVYANCIWDVRPFLRYTLNTAWDFEHDLLDHINIRCEWTLSENLALATEYRHRSDFCWRKNEYYNFILESFRPEFELRHSQLSDRRDTILWRTFYRFHPNLIFEGQVRHGWNRRHEPNYLEYQYDLLINLPAAWNLRFSYQKKEDDHRFAVYFSLGTAKPRQCGD